MYLFGGPHNKDYNIYCGLYWGPLILGNYHILKEREHMRTDMERAPEPAEFSECLYSVAGAKEEWGGGAGSLKLSPTP